MRTPLHLCNGGAREVLAGDRCRPAKFGHESSARPKNPETRERGGSAMANVEQELLRMSETLRVLEDEREIIRLISAYGPAVDSGQSEAAAAIWTEDGRLRHGFGGLDRAGRDRRHGGGRLPPEAHRRGGGARGGRAAHPRERASSSRHVLLAGVPARRGRLRGLARGGEPLGAGAHAGRLAHGATAPTGCIDGSAEARALLGRADED